MSTEDLRPYARELLRSCAARDPRHREYFVALARKYGLNDVEIEAELCATH
ncbi:hypothetical protein [Rhodococcoides fascians]|uniref:hypothetical protein n=1 Tax=Rhodococcoides fascians TaxID=1828 RepID=UPI000AE4611B|nr:hypothetical protein [Rhodococcus fascians]